MKGPIETLMQEHRLIEKMLDSLERFSHESIGPSEKDRAELGCYVTFFQTLADRCHHAKEEALLFEALRAHGMPKEAGPLAVMYEEHALGRHFLRRVDAVAAGAVAPSPEAWTAAMHSAREFILLLRNHIRKEDEILFPIAMRILPEAVRGDLARAFDEFERREMGEGVHERMHELADSLLHGVRS
jgi:hemerythrin-like domain-containing protein